MSTSLKNAALDILHQLIDFVHQLPDELYAKPLPILSGHTIGKHTRHIIEFYECVLKGESIGVINYDSRSRDSRLEADTLFCKHKLHQIISLVESVSSDKNLTLQICLFAGSEPVLTQTCLFRELIHTIEHTIHHMAILKMAVSSLDVSVKLPPCFGVAPSTLQYQASGTSPDVNSL
jgi:uncharacterized damage-inducible protein DinB